MTSVQVVESLLDPREFARQLIGEPLWAHQQQVVTSPARTRVMVSGRQAGKSRTLAVIALHAAFTRRDCRVLILSAGEDAAKELLEDIKALSSSPLLSGSEMDSNTQRVVLSNGSVIRCIPASERQARGPSVDLLILDEAASISDELWRAVRYTIIAKPESRVVMAGTPFGSQDRFFGQAFRLGKGGAEGYESFHWPSQVSPLVDDRLLQDWRRTDPDWVYRQEVLAEWVQDQQAYFSAEELHAATADYELMSPAVAREASPFVQGPGYQRTLPAVMGIDWGLRRDANAVALVAPLEDWGLNDDRLGVGQRALFVPWLRAEMDWSWPLFVQHLVEVCSSYLVHVAASEVNGVGDPATFMLRQGLQRVGLGSSVHVCEVWTDARRKQAGFGKLKALLQQERLVLPRHPELLRQLNALQFEYSPSGSVKIAVPERAGHDDLALALMQAVSCVGEVDDFAWRNPGGSFYASPGDWEAAEHGYQRSRERLAEQLATGELDVVTSNGGLLVPRQPVPLRDTGQWWYLPAGREQAEPW
ncbi:hypothetical protein DQ244_06105 [Blastococcus sp. TBT05-19]|uniref:terminase large subunit domain-containing protein n=1 Tax=Blastococcus sp. TBT05-19 TaxID=2250581 RepID=UPI000DEB8E76|nr:terminase family protein [Blastococcus sp. TBT05-19]RBY94831.1 hypothetical protein DQ244_06105 [Blastococcus sp. TBT05-19]